MANKKKKNHRNKNASPIQFIKQNFKWTSLAFIAFWQLLWQIMLGFGKFYEWDFLSTSLFAGGGSPVNAGGQQFPIYALYWLFAQMHAGLFLYELFIALAITAVYWWCALTLHKSGMKFWLIAVVISFYCLFPENVYISWYAGKDQFLSVAALALVVYMYRVWRGKDLGWQQMAILCALLAVNILAKYSNAVLAIPVFAMIVIMRKSWKQILAVTAIGFAIGYFGTNLFSASMQREVVDSSSGSTLTYSPAAALGGLPGVSFWGMAGVANAFQNPDAVISNEDRAYFDSVMMPNWSASYWPAQSFDTFQEGLYIEGADASGMWAHVQSVCDANSWDCWAGWFQSKSPWFLPKTIVQAWLQPDDAVMHPYLYMNWNPRVDGTFNANEHICKGLPDGFTNEQMKECMVAAGYSADDAGKYVDSWSPAIREQKYEGPLAGLQDFTIKFWQAISLTMDGFWLFWALFAMLVIAIARKKYRKFIPFLLVPISLFGVLIFWAPVAYERYLFPIYFLVPFLIALMLSQSKRFRR